MGVLPIVVEVVSIKCVGFEALLISLSDQLQYSVLHSLVYGDYQTLIFNNERTVPFPFLEYVQYVQLSICGKNLL